eukprot:m.335515 g.335515  ORF g.335515 m.335515 type:complete len:1221 (+) comp55681_c0_seq1:23-3685(+)
MLLLLALPVLAAAADGSPTSSVVAGLAGVAASFVILVLLVLACIWTRRGRKTKKDLELELDHHMSGSPRSDEIFLNFLTDWFHGPLTANQAEARLINFGLKDGAFLIWNPPVKTARDPTFYLTMSYNLLANHYPIESKDGLLRMRGCSMSFGSLSGIVEHLKQNADGLPCSLGSAVSLRGAVAPTNHHAPYGSMEADQMEAKFVTVSHARENASELGQVPTHQRWEAAIRTHSFRHAAAPSALNLEPLDQAIPVEPPAVGTPIAMPTTPQPAPPPLVPVSGPTPASAVTDPDYDLNMNAVYSNFEESELEVDPANLPKIVPRIQLAGLTQLDVSTDPRAPGLAAPKVAVETYATIDESTVDQPIYADAELSLPPPVVPSRPASQVVAPVLPPRNANMELTYESIAETQENDSDADSYEEPVALPPHLAQAVQRGEVPVELSPVPLPPVPQREFTVKALRVESEYDDVPPPPATGAPEHEYDDVHHVFHAEPEPPPLPAPNGGLAQRPPKPLPPAISLTLPNDSETSAQSFEAEGFLGLAHDTFRSMHLEDGSAMNASIYGTAEDLPTPFHLSAGYDPSGVAPVESAYDPADLRFHSALDVAAQSSAETHGTLYDSSTWALTSPLQPPAYVNAEAIRAQAAGHGLETLNSEKFNSMLDSSTFEEIIPRARESVIISAPRPGVQISNYEAVSMNPAPLPPPVPQEPTLDSHSNPENQPDGEINFDELEPPLDDAQEPQEDDIFEDYPPPASEESDKSSEREASSPHDSGEEEQGVEYAQPISEETSPYADPALIPNPEYQRPAYVLPSGTRPNEAAYQPLPSMHMLQDETPIIEFPSSSSGGSRHMSNSGMDTLAHMESAMNMIKASRFGSEADSPGKGPSVPSPWHQEEASPADGDADEEEDDEEEREEGHQYMLPPSLQEDLKPAYQNLDTGSHAPFASEPIYDYQNHKSPSPVPPPLPTKQSGPNSFAAHMDAQNVNSAGSGDSNSNSPVDSPPPRDSSLTRQVSRVAKLRVVYDPQAEPLKPRPTDRPKSPLASVSEDGVKLRPVQASVRLPAAAQVSAPQAPVQASPPAKPSAPVQEYYLGEDQYLSPSDLISTPKQPTNLRSSSYDEVEPVGFGSAAYGPFRLAAIHTNMNRAEAEQILMQTRACQDVDSVFLIRQRPTAGQVAVSILQGGMFIHHLVDIIGSNKFRINEGPTAFQGTPEDALESLGLQDALQAYP